MTEEEQDLTVRAAWHAAVGFVKQVTAIIAGFSAIGAGLWYMFGDHLSAIADLPETNAAITEKLVAIQADLDALRVASNARVRAVVEFQGTPNVVPHDLRAPGRVFATYHLRRNESCSGTIVRRWWNVELGVYDPQFETSQRVQRAPVTSIYQLWKLPLDIPALPAGEWAYHPELIPGPDCNSDLPVVIPPAYFTVLE